MASGVVADGDQLAAVGAVGEQGSVGVSAMPAEYAGIVGSLESDDPGFEDLEAAGVRVEAGGHTEG